MNAPLKRCAYIRKETAKNEERTEFETITLGRYNFTENSDGTVTTSAYTGDHVEENSKDTTNLKKCNIFL